MHLKLKYVKGHKWIDTIKRFQWYNYEVYYIDLKWIKTEINNFKY